MKTTRSGYFYFLAVLILTLAHAAPVQAATTINVSLWDKGGNVANPTDLGMQARDLSGATMGVKLSAATAKAGWVTFVVTNDSKETIHEMLIFPVPADGQQIPYDAGEARLDEEKGGDLGEVSELDPGKSGELKLELKPGKYALICNIAGHYMAGMWTVLTVE